MKETKAARTSPAPIAPVALTPSQENFLEAIVLEGMARMRWSRKYAERMARKFLSKADTPEKLANVAAKLGRLDSAPPKATFEPCEKKAPDKKRLPKNEAKPKPKPALTRAQIAKLPPTDAPRPKPKTAKERLERALGPDDGKRRRGGSPVLQGGSPGLGRRS